VVLLAVKLLSVASNDVGILDEVQTEYLAKEGPVITVLTGTHVIGAGEVLENESLTPTCQAVNSALRILWTHFGDGLHYVRAKDALDSALRKLDKADRCVITETDRGYWYTFPMTVKSNKKCTLQLARELSNRKFLLGTSGDALTRITVPWFVLRPDLVTFERMCYAAGVRLRYLVTVGHDVESAAFMQEGCPRFRTVLAKRDLYKQMLLLVAISDLSFQLGKLEHAEVVISECKRSKLARREVQDVVGDIGGAKRDLNAKFLDDSLYVHKALQCKRSNTSLEDTLGVEGSLSFSRSILANELFRGALLRKSIFSTKENKIPTVVFIAGVEGSGHHLMSLLGRRHTTRELYDALTNYLADVRWLDDSLQHFEEARTRLINAMVALHNTTNEDGTNLFFLNTVFVDTAVNMYSYPWGGPRCYLKKFARIVCNTDLYDLVRMGQEAGVDFRVVVLRRALGAAIVSSAINRDFGTVISQTRTLGMSWSLLRSGLRSIDRAFVEEFSYEDLVSEPWKDYDRLIGHLNIEPGSYLANHFNSTLTDSYLQFGKKNAKAWKVKLTDNQFAMISDLLYFPRSLVKDFNTEEAILGRAARAAKLAAEARAIAAGRDREAVAAAGDAAAKQVIQDSQQQQQAPQT